MTPLSKREHQVATLVSLGKTNKEIGDELRLQEGTVKNYLNRILKKLRLKNRTQLAVHVIDNGASGAAIAAVALTCIPLLAT